MAAARPRLGSWIRGVAKPRHASSSKESSDRLATVAGSTAELVEQLIGRPRRLTTCVPFGQYVQRLIVVQCKTAYQPTADAEGVNVAVLACDGRRHRREVSLRTLDDGNVESNFGWTTRWSPGRRLLRPWKVFRSVANLPVQVRQAPASTCATYLLCRSWRSTSASTCWLVHARGRIVRPRRSNSWPHMTLWSRRGGTDMNRRTLETVARAGFQITRVDPVFLDVILAVEARLSS